jgi:hypothetical protein
MKGRIKNTVVEDLESDENVMAKMIKEWKTIEKMGGTELKY